MIAYALPTPNGRVLWVPAPRFCWGELEGLGDRITVLTPDPNMDISKLPLLFHDNLYRPVVRRAFYYRFLSSWIPRAMLWGVIWLLGRTAGESALEGIVSGLYLLIGLPFFSRWSADISKRQTIKVRRRFDELFYAPLEDSIDVVYSPRLNNLEAIIEKFGATTALETLDKLGLMHLREFYKRVAWSGRWEVGPPTGQGVLK